LREHAIQATLKTQRAVGWRYPEGRCGARTGEECRSGAGVQAGWAPELGASESRENARAKRVQEPRGHNSRERAREWGECWCRLSARAGREPDIGRSEETAGARAGTGVGKEQEWGAEWRRKGCEAVKRQSLFCERPHVVCKTAKSFCMGALDVKNGEVNMREATT
jgi:hypothetical protein